MNRLEQWFDAQNWRVFAFQRQVWRAYRARASGLVHAPTGNGKSLAAFGGALLEALDEAGTSSATPLRVLWITPLRALATDLEENLRKPIADLGLDWQVERRTGDTGSAARSRQRKRLPTVLITTPESLSLLLSYADTAVQFQALHCVVVDEWHELLSSKRGVQTELCLARLRKLAPGLRTWGLTATLGNPQQALEVLLGPGRTGRLIAGEPARPLTIRTLIPDTMERFPWAGHLGLKLLPEVIDTLQAAETTLLFTNTRSQAELWYQALLVLRPEWEDAIALHHGSIDRKQRQLIEDRLRAGTLHCVVCTSSLDLGVDFCPVDQVILVGSPKGIARLIQRAGRSGHQPGATSSIVCVPTHAFELVEIAAVRKALADGRIEQRRPLELSLDVLVQHLVTLAVGGGFETPDILAEIRSTHAYRDITEAEWQWALDFITRGGEALQHYPQYQKVVRKERRYAVEAPRIARLHRMSVGTITSNSVMRVRFVSGGDLGHIEEAFIAKLRPHDRFVFAGRRLELVRVRDMTAYVRLAKSSINNTPRWSGSRLPISGELAAEMLAVMQQQATGSRAYGEMDAVSAILALQRRWSALPKQGELLIEQVRSREGQHLFCYPFAGRSLHEGLAALTAYRLSRAQPATYTISFNDYGFELLTAKSEPLTEQQLREAFAVDGLRDAILTSVNVSELAKRQFRDIARVAGLVFQGYPGQDRSARQIQASSGLIYDVLSNYDRGNLLLDQATREVLDHQLEYHRLSRVLRALSEQPLTLAYPPRLTPLAFPLWAERVQFQVSSENWKQRVERMVVQLEKAADKVIDGDERSRRRSIRRA